MSSHKPGQPPAQILPAVQKLALLYEAADMRYPAELFPEPRRIRRKIIMHVGPTNSGKTYNALRALAASKRGVYAGPLRLLAHEVYTRLNKGVILPAGIERNPLDPDKLYPRACNMITGEEKRIVAEDAPLTSCTVEMLQWITHYDVAVVDEIQMIGDEQRGGAWTSAVLGLMADELHLCGEESAVPVVEALAKETGDELIVNHYERLSPLHAASSSLEGDFSKLREGDCVVAFSRRLIFDLKHKIEQSTSFRCAVAYGMLPPELRAEQAALFNDPDNEYGIMVASDAIGMGLNLKIKRIIFYTTQKWDGQQMIPLSLSTVKQIAGRAGRFSLGAQQTSAGIATSMEPEDLPVIQLAMRIPTRPLKRAVIAPTPEQVQAILQLLPAGTPPSVVFEILPWMARVPNMFTLVDVAGAVQQAKLLETLGGGTMSISEYWVLLHTPAPLKEEVVTEAVSRLVPAYKDRQSTSLISILDGIGLMRILEQASKLRHLYEAEGSTARQEHGNPPVNAPVLAELERMHRVLIMYLWLSYRLPVAFSEQERAFEIKQELERCIAFFLSELKPGSWTAAPPHRFGQFVAGLPDKPTQRSGGEDAFEDEVSEDPEWMQEVNTA
ncbi:P-loop containing nucleoside triphosphate hydrolase protein [Auricularia subglabra TFB-10046 SS5]|nr:P-loop containing nucleoside triphosphate hydrolase protein [Auricularia subglabra TFB-10046 SS5]